MIRLGIALALSAFAKTEFAGVSLASIWESITTAWESETRNWENIS